MARIEITASSLIVHIEGADRLWALKGTLEVADPEEAVARIRAATAR